MKCPECRADSEVIDSREMPDGCAVRRRRQCLAPAKHRWTTHEYETQRVAAYVPKPQINR